MANLGVLGNKYYISSPDGEFEIVRVIKAKKSGELTIRNEENGNTTKTSIENLKELGYKKLKPNGVISFTVVKVGEDPKTKYPVEDVVVCLFRQDDLNTNNGVPYAVCRQNINDIFYQFMASNPTDEQFVGLSCTQDSFPEMEHIDFSAVLVCEEVYEDRVTNVNIYLQDTLDSILNMIKVSVYDKVLSNLRQSYIRTTIETCNLLQKDIPKIIILDPPSKPPLMGYCNTLKELLEVNNFDYDFDSTFGIVPVNFTLIYDENTGVLHPEQVHIIESITHYKIGRTCVLKYDHDIDLKTIKLNYQLIRDTTGNVFVVSFVIEGEYVENDIEIAKMKNNMIEYLAYSTSKYSSF